MYGINHTLNVSKFLEDKFFYIFSGLNGKDYCVWTMLSCMCCITNNCMIKVSTWQFTKNDASVTSIYFGLTAFTDLQAALAWGVHF